MSARSAPSPKAQLLVAFVVLIGLFFLEYPPIFLFGYWSWGPATHKVLSGVLLILNLVVAQYVGRRASSFGHRASPVAGAS